MKRKLPDHIPGTSRAWKQRKRREWESVLLAYDRFQRGCAYTPAYEGRRWDESPVSRLEDAIKEITDALSFKRWGR